MRQTKIRRVLVCAIIADSDMSGNSWRYVEMPKGAKEKQGVIALSGLASE